MSLFLPSLLCLAVAGAGSSASIDDGTRAEQAPPLHSWNAGAVASVARSDDRQAPEDKPLVEKPALQLGPHKIYFGLDVLFAGVWDGSERAAMGREQQIRVAFANLSAYGDIGDHLSFVVTANPADDGRVPRPYIPSPDDRRTYFFPNQPEGRGVSSDPSGLYKVDDYKHSGLDPILQQGALRVACFDIHTASRRYGMLAGRSYVPQGLSLDEITWFTAKDLTHIQMINAQADNGLTLYYDAPWLRVDLAAISGNGNPYHDYGYFDFTDPTEDKNSALGGVLTGRLRLPKTSIGATYRRNFLNSRIEDSISIQLGKHNDDAVILFATSRPVAYLRVFGEYARYKWGLAASPARLLPDAPITTPVIKHGYYAGAELTSPPTALGRWALVLTREKLSRDDSLVSWAAANQLFGVTMGKKERSTIVKVQVEFGRQLAAFFFLNNLSNPFPELSAIKPISGRGSDQSVSNRKVGFGLRLRI